MTADQIYAALTQHGKPVPPERLKKAEQRADSPAVWADVQRRLVGYVPTRQQLRRGRVVVNG